MNQKYVIAGSYFLLDNEEKPFLGIFYYDCLATATSIKTRIEKACDQINVKHNLFIKLI